MELDCENIVDDGGARTWPIAAAVAVPIGTR
jgi:hypothetical protein